MISVRHSNKLSSVADDLFEIRVDTSHLNHVVVARLDRVLPAVAIESYTEDY